MPLRRPTQETKVDDAGRQHGSAGTHSVTTCNACGTYQCNSQIIAVGGKFYITTRGTAHVLHAREVHAREDGMEAAGGRQPWQQFPGGPGPAAAAGGGGPPPWGTAPAAAPAPSVAGGPQIYHVPARGSAPSPYRPQPLLLHQQHLPSLAADAVAVAAAVEDAYEPLVGLKCQKLDAPLPLCGQCHRPTFVHARTEPCLHWLCLECALQVREAASPVSCPVCAENFTAVLGLAPGDRPHPCVSGQGCSAPVYLNKRSLRLHETIAHTAS